MRAGIRLKEPAEFSKYRHWQYYCSETVSYQLYLFMKRIAYSKAATKALRKMQSKRAAAIIANGEPVDLKTLQGSEFFRIRVGQDRVIIDDQTMQVLVIKAGPRGDIYND
jgi:mRNA interferase RelE/StbE